MVDRQDFFAAMTDALAGRQGDSLLHGQFQPGQVKVRLVEVHAREQGEDGAKALLESAFVPDGHRVERLADDLFILKGDDLAIAVDSLDGRFWQMYCTAPTAPFSRALRRVLSTHTEFDSAWMPKSLLQDVEGRHRWLKSSFESDDLLGDTSPTRRWRARFEGDAPDELLDLLSSEPRYARASAVSAIGTDLEESGVGTAQLFADWRGGFTIAKGDFSVGASAITRTAERYRTFVLALEDHHRIRFSSDSESPGCGISFEGGVAVIPFEEPLQNLDQVVEGLFQAKEPFRLSAVPRRIGDDEWEANAVDLHVGQPLRLELSPYRLRVILREQTCGNTLARLLTNLQHRFDARVSLEPAVA